MNNMNEAVFRKQYLGDFRIDEKTQQLQDRLMQYYKESEECSNQLAMHYWKDFKHWCNLRCITTKEINQAKKSVAHLVK